MSNYPALYVVVDGIRWDLFSVTYQHGDHLFSFYLYAKNREQAETMVEDIKKGAKLDEDTIVGFSDHEPTIEEMKSCEAPPVFH